MIKTKTEIIIDEFRRRLKEMPDIEFEALADKIDASMPTEDQIWSLVTKWCDEQTMPIDTDSRRHLMDLISNLIGIQKACIHKWITSGSYVGEDSVRKCAQCGMKQIID